MLRRLAGGGMGEVYLAAANGPAGFVKHAVVKRILPHYAQDPEFVAMFVNEARLAAALDHPNIVRVYDFGEAQGNFFYAMEYLHGDSLAALLPRLAKAGERLPLAHALTIGLGISAGLHFAHEGRAADGGPLEIVHRDVSPANVFLTVAGEVKLLDFGIAKVLSTTKVTRDGTRKGKVPYMSPEQCIGEPLDRRSDVFSLGILLYEMTTMSRLYRGDNEFATMNMITAGTIPPPSSRVPDYPPALAAVVLKALCRERSGRYASALELHEALEKVADELGLRTSALALGRLVRRLIDDRPYPSTDATSPAEEPQTAVFFAALNEALTVRDVGAAAASEPSRPVIEVTAEPTSARDRIGPTPQPGRASRVLGLGGAAALLLAVAWWALRGTPPAIEATPEPAPAPVTVPVSVPVSAPAVPATPPTEHVSPPPTSAPTPAPTPTVEPRTSTKTPRKKPARKTNVLDSLRPSK